ncbi:LPS export ABC transporter periplasmic protein LptC [Rudanella lutea]|uniref:LPS export ABC transporter periplasmic protein LptC n=1 Tax=Rudanella lutea TaxID=451374 RepID=UPI0003A031E0|nr:LPS export ABC transporter periplasmic protein LptC [Rudanella lutea]
MITRLLWCGLLLMVGLWGCEEPKTTRKTNAYQGPIEEINNVKMLYSEAAVLRVRMTTAKQYRYQNDDRKYPQTVNILFFGPNGEEVTTLRSDSGRYDKAKNLYTVMGNVVVINKQKQEKLTTNELNWNPQTKKVFTEKPVLVQSKLTGESLRGLGLDANQDFSQYSIRKVTGVFNVEGGGGF